MLLWKKNKKKNLDWCEQSRFIRKIPGTVLLSHSQIYSTIAAGALNYRVREGNVCFCSAMDTGNINPIKKSLVEVRLKKFTYFVRQRTFFLILKS